ncbi:MAG TPA: RHS repeat-associated core domain-containing protein [Candidatus Binataceae bacterium]|nr:RHS repeat-associated core domain-containing protein [Candidatus Binataceae bacterium]
MRKRLFASVALCLVLALAAGRASSQEDPPETPDLNQSLPPDPGDVGYQSALDSDLSCTYPESIDPSSLDQANATMMSLPTSPSDAQVSSTAANVAPIQNSTADPVSGDGEFAIHKTHLSFPGNGINYEFTLNYRSRIDHQTPAGFGWSHNYDRHIEDLSPTGTPDCEGDVYYVSDRMERITFKPNGTTADPNVTVYKPATDAPLILEKHPNDTSYYILRDGSGLTYHFKSSQQAGTYLLYKIADPTGNAIFIYWDDSIKNGDGGIVTKVIDTDGRTFYYNYDLQTGQIIPDSVAVDAGENCAPITTGGYTYPDYQCIAAAQQAARMGTFAILKCISTKENDCSAPLVSLQHSPPDPGTEFDLTGVLDADGNGPTFSYYNQPEVADYIPDEELVSSCHTICDTKAIATDWSCHNLDRCGDPGIQDAVTNLCAGVGDRLLVQIESDPNNILNVIPTTYSCTTYGMHACGDPGGNCYSQNWYTDHYGHWYDVFQTSYKCPYDDGNLNTSKALPEPSRNAACDGWLADSLSYCNSTLPDVLAALAQPNVFPPGYTVLVNGQARTVYDVFCQGIFGEAGDDIVHSQICNQYQADCQTEMKPKVTEAFQSCPTECFQTCRAGKGATDSKNTRRYAFGLPQDLNHNLISVHDGDGRLVVQNTYGLDPFQSSFDRVVLSQETDSIEDNKVGYAYHDLQGEQAMSGVDYFDYLAGLGLSKEELFAQIICLGTNGCVPFYTVNPDAQHVVPLAQFGSVDICPTTCTRWGPKIPPPQYIAQGMIPWSAIDPEKPGYFYNGDPVVLQSDGRGLFSLTGAGPTRSLTAGQTLYQTTLPQGTVALRSLDGGQRVSLVGNPAAIGALFRNSDTLILQAGSGGKLRPAKATQPAALPRFALRGTAPLPAAAPAAPRVITGTPSAARTPPVVQPPPVARVAALSNPAAAPMRNPVPETKSATTPTVVQRESTAIGISSIAFARGLRVGSWPIVIRRSGSTATIGDSYVAGATIETLMTPNGAPISIVATEDPAKFSVTGNFRSLMDSEGRIGIVSPSVDEVYAVPAGLLTGEAQTKAISMTAQDGVRSGILTLGMVCQQEAIGSAVTTPGQAIAPQIPGYAVVVHDLHGVVRTDYYDDQWLLLREANFNNGETTNYNYQNGTLKAVQSPTGVRVCQDADIFGKPMQVTRLPAPGYPGDTAAHVTKYAYSHYGRLTDVWIDPGLPTESHVHRQRDSWDRVSWIDTTIGTATTERTTFDYHAKAQGNPQDTAPYQITKPDGSKAQISMDPSGGGPATTTIPVTGDTPLATYASYDTFGRMLESGRIKHGGTVSKTQYDAAGLRVLSQAADLLNPGSFLSTKFDYDSSQQLSHSGDPLVDRYYQYDPYDHLNVEVDAPKDGKTARKSTCTHYSVDGRPEYSISAEGIVTLNTYDDSGRLIQVDRGHPPKLSDWTTDCLNGKRAPGSKPLVTITIPSAAVLLPYQTPQDSIREQVAPAQIVQRAISSPQQSRPLSEYASNLIATVLNAIGRIFHSGLVAIGGNLDGLFGLPPPPSWPSDVPTNDPGMQTIRIVNYAPGGFLLSDSDGSGVGGFVVTDGFGRVIDEMNGDPKQIDPTTIVHHWKGYDAQDRVIWDATLQGPNIPAYAKPQAPFPGLASMAEYHYDATGRRIETDTWFLADGKAAGQNLITSTKITYDDADRRMTTQVDQHPARVEQSDELGRITSTTLPNGVVQTTQYQEALNGDTQTKTSPGPDGQSIVLTDTFDDQGHILSRFQGKDERLHQQYDSFGRLTSKRTVELTNTTFDYDAYSRMTEATTVAAPSPDRTNQFGYDRDDRKVSISVINATGTATTQFTFDGADRLMVSQDPMGRLTKRDYYPNSTRLHHLTDPLGTVTVDNYDYAGRLVNEAVTPGQAPGLDPKVITRSFSYSPLGSAISATVTSKPADATNNLQITMGYDSMGNRILESTNGFLPIEVHHTFDQFAKPLTTTLVGASGNTVATINKSFDELHRLATASLNQTPIATLGYGGLGGPTTLNYGARASDPKSQSGVTSTIQYDFRGRATGIDVANSSSIIASEHDMLGFEGIPRARSVQLGAKATALYDAFEIDNAARLIKEAQQVNAGNFPARELANADVDPLMLNGQGHLFYTLDGIANWQQLDTEKGTSAVQIDPANEYLSVGNEAIANDPAGQVVGIGADSYTFDGFGKLASATSNGTTVHYGYDALGRRVAETSLALNAPSVTEFFLWDGSAILAMGASPSDPATYRLRIGGDGLNTHLLVADKLGTATPYYVHQGPSGSVIALTTDSGLIEGYRYTAFGKTQFIASDGTLAKDGNGLPLTASSVDNRLLYQGQLYDPPIAAYSMREREYNPALGRFLSPDPSGAFGGDNPFVFVNGMPLTLSDPFGLASQAAVDDTMMSSPDFNESNMPPPSPAAAPLNYTPQLQLDPQLFSPNVPAPSYIGPATGPYVPTGWHPGMAPDQQLSFSIEQLSDPQTIDQIAQMGDLTQANITRAIDSLSDVQKFQMNLQLVLFVASAGPSFGPDIPSGGGGIPGLLGEGEGGGLPSGPTFAGHGLTGGNTFIMPEGSSLTVYAPPGYAISNGLGTVIELGQVPEGLYQFTYAPGAITPNVMVSPLTGDAFLNIVPGTQAVTEFGWMDELIGPNMGACTWAGCLTQWEGSLGTYGIFGPVPNSGLGGPF